MPTDTVPRDLLVRQLDAWLPAALQRARRATLALAYAGAGAEGADAALKAVGEHADRLRGFRLTVLVLAEGDEGLPARLGAAEAGLPAEVAVHVVPGGPERLPVALKAAGAAGAPLLTLAHGAAPDPALLAAARVGRPADLLLVAEPGTPLRPTLEAAGFPLVAEADLLDDPDAGLRPDSGRRSDAAQPTDSGRPTGAGRRLAFATGSDRGLQAFKDALWAAGEGAGVRYRDPADPEGAALAASPTPDPEPLGRELLAELRRSGPRTVTELRRYALTSTLYRSADATRALTALLEAGAVTREPGHGRLGGDVLISPAADPVA
jgi:DNA-binding transcriptional ArsR family regulator